MSERLRIDAFGRSFPLDPARVYWIGTNADADIVVQSRLAAPVHALISCEAGAWTIQVVGAAPAIRVSGRALEPGAPAMSIGPGLVLEIGGDTLRVQRDDTAAGSALAQATRTVAALLGKPRSSGTAPAAFRILYPGGADGPRREPVEIAAERASIGSGADCAVRLDDPTVPARVAALVRTPHGFRVEPLVQPLPAGVTLLAEDRLLATGDRLAVGPFDLRVVVEGETAGINVQRRHRVAPAPALATIAMPAAAGPSAPPSGGPARSEAPRYRPTSDLVRARVVVPLILVAAVAVGGTWALAGGDPSAVAGRPIGAHHQAVGMTCTSCHAPGGRVMTEACAGCHAPSIAPAEPTHGKLARASRRPHGFLTCTACHRIHSGFEVVTASRPAVGAPVRIAHVLDGATTSEASLPPTHPLGQYLPPGRTVAWPVVRGARCAGCHHLDAAADPARRCFADPTDASTLAVSCDDEHREEPTPEAAVATVARRAVLAPGGDVAAARALGVMALSRSPGAVTASDAGTGPLRAGAVGLVLLGVALGALASRRRFVAAVTAPAPRAAADPSASSGISLVRGKLVPAVDAARCIGCGACVQACPRGVLALQHFWAEVVAPDACCGFMLCEAVCPNRSLTIVEGEPPSDRPRRRPDGQSADVPGLWIAGDVAGAPLIKLAIQDGTQCVDAIAESLAGAPAAPAGVLDLAVVGAGPAGLSALLRARERGLFAAALERGDAAQTIQLFPRSKLVRVLPLDLPMVGALPLEAGPDGGVSKEALLTQWLRLVREEGLDVRERHEVEAIRREGDAFALDVAVHPRTRHAAVERATVRARRVLVAIGRRGTPRPLEIPVDPQMAGRLAYHLADAAALRGLSVVVSGLGDTALEAAIALGEQDATPVHVVYRGAELVAAGRDPRNVRRFRDLVGRGRVTVHWSSRISRVEPGVAVIEPTGGDGPPVRVRADQVLVFHGGTTPRALLARFGVRVAAEAGAAAS